MKKPWSKPGITRIVCPALALAILITTQTGGRIKFNNLKLKPGIGTLSVRPAGVVIKP